MGQMNNIWQVLVTKKQIRRIQPFRHHIAVITHRSQSVFTSRFIPTHYGQPTYRKGKSIVKCAQS